MDSRRIGSDFDDSLRDEGVLDETEGAATKRVIADKRLQVQLTDESSETEFATTAGNRVLRRSQW